jgi:anti-anti-sigma factor
MMSLFETDAFASLPETYSSLGQVNLRVEEEHTLSVTLRIKVLQSTCATELKALVKQCLGKPNLKHVLLNLSQVTHMDSFGLASVLGLYKELRESGGHFILVNPNSNLLQLIEITRLNHVLPIVDTVPQALELIRTNP